MQKIKSAIQLKEAQLFLDECVRTHEKVWIVSLTRGGELRRYDGWQVISSHWRGGTHNLLNPSSGQKRKVIDVMMFEINGHPIYL